MKKVNDLYEKRVKTLKNIINKKFKPTIKINYKKSSDEVVNQIKKNMLENNILEENEIYKKILTIKRDLHYLFEINNSNGYFFKYDKKRYSEIERLEGHPVSGGIFINILFKSDEILVTEITRKKYSKEPLYNNHDHKTISILKKGKLRLLIDDDTFIAEKGDLWIYKPNNHHSIEALENSVELSIKFPPVKTW